MKYKGIKKLYYSISEISDMLGIKQSVIRYWESEFKELKPQKNRAGNRIYKKDDIAILRMINHYVHEKHLSIHEANEVIMDLKKEGLYKRKLQELNKVELKPTPVEEPEAPVKQEIIEEPVVVSTDDLPMPAEAATEEETEKPDFEIVTPTQETFIYPLDDEQTPEGGSSSLAEATEDRKKIEEEKPEKPEELPEPGPVEVPEPEPVPVPEPVKQSDPELRELLKKISGNIKDIIDILNE